MGAISHLGDKGEIGGNKGKPRGAIRGRKYIPKRDIYGLKLGDK